MTTDFLCFGTIPEESEDEDDLEGTLANFNTSEGAAMAAARPGRRR